MSDTAVPTRLTLDDYVERFEDAWNEASDGAAPTMERFLPPETQPDYKNVCVELMRVDMERRWDRDQKKRLAKYCDEHPWLRQDKVQLGELAFEEFRLRAEHNDDVSAKTYARDFGIDTAAWPEPAAARVDTKALRNWNESTLDILASDADRLVSSIESFPEVGQTFGDFTLRELIGEGKFSRVFLAHQGELANRLVVLKVSAEVCSESDKLARLQHTNIVPIYSFHRVGNLQALCMPYLGRETLEDKLRHTREMFASSDDRSRTARRAQECSLCEFSSQLADGLAHAHHRKIVHRDLKPANILVSDEGYPLILDFNLSEHLVVGGPTSLLVGGTLPYMAPEHLESVLSRDRLDERCDVYSVGVLLYQMITGALPFPRRDGNFIESVSRMIHDRKKLEDWKIELAKRCSVDLQSIVGKCLEPDRDRRYQNAEQLRDDLRRHAGDLPLLHAPNRSPQQRLGKWLVRNRHRATLGSVTAVAAVLLAVSAVASMLFASRMRAADARAQAGEFAREFENARLALVLALNDDTRPFVDEALAESEAAVGRFGVLDLPRWPEQAPFAALTPQQKLETGRQIRTLLALMANSQPARADEWLARRNAWRPSAAVAASSTNKPVCLVIDQLWHEGKFSEASRIIAAGLEADPTDAALWLQRGFYLHRAGEFSEAELSFTRCIALYPNSPQGYFLRGSSRLEQGRPGPAEQDFSRVIALRPNTCEAFFNRALARELLGRYKAALADCAEALKGNRAHVRIFALRSQILAKLDRHEEALADRAAAINAEPHGPQDWVRRGLLQIDEDPAAAADDFVKALSLQPDHHKALQNLAHVYADVLCDNARALEVLHEFAESYPRDPIAPAGQAVVLARTGEYEAAAQHAECALQISRTAETCYQVASAFALMSQDDAANADRAVALLRECLQQDTSWMTTLITDEDFRPLRENQQLLKLLAAVKFLREP